MSHLCNILFIAFIHRVSAGIVGQMVLYMSHHCQSFCFSACTVKSGRKTRSRKYCTQERAIYDVLASVHLSSSSDEEGDSSEGDLGEDNTTCPKCGIRYVDSSDKWICCDGCNMWFNKKCTNIKGRVPKVFYCETCAL